MGMIKRVLNEIKILIRKLLYKILKVINRFQKNSQNSSQSMTHRLHINEKRYINTGIVIWRLPICCASATVCDVPSLQRDEAQRVDEGPRCMRRDLPVSW